MTKKKLSHDTTQIEEIIERARVIQLAFSNDDRPYLIPFSYGYRDGALYFHSKKSGKKLDMLATNDQVAFALQEDVRLLEKDDPCGFSFIYASVSGWGRARIIEDIEGKREALSILARQYGARPVTCPDEDLSGVVVFKLIIEEMTLKTAVLK